MNYELNQAIINAQKHIALFQPNPSGFQNYKAPVNNHETSTRYILIDPILKSLNWDLSNPSECILEYPTKQIRKGALRSRIDYILLDTSKLPAIAIEAKRIDSSLTDLDLDQVTNYLKDLPTVHTAILTNGCYWMIAKKNKNIGWQPVHQKPISLYTDPKISATTLHNILNKDVINSPKNQETTFKQAFKNNVKPTPHPRFKSTYLKAYQPP